MTEIDESVVTNTDAVTEATFEDGCLGTGNTDTDYPLLCGDGNVLPNLVKQDLQHRYEYNQRNQDWSTSSCTIFSAISAVSDLVQREFTLDEIKEVDEMSYAKGRVRGGGWYTKSAVDLVVNWYNDKFGKNGKLAYYLVDMDDADLVKTITELGYNICSGYYGNSKYSKDFSDDSILDGAVFGQSTYGHAVNVIANEKNDMKRSVKDNYKGRVNAKKKDSNFYELKHTTAEIDCWHKYGYLITKVKEDNLEEIKRLNELRTALSLTIELNSKMWHLVNDENYKAALHYANEQNRKKMRDVEEQIKKFS